jgi:hypothetical protein
MKITFENGYTSNELEIYHDNGNATIAISSDSGDNYEILEYQVKNKQQLHDLIGALLHIQSKMRGGKS